MTSQPKSLITVLSYPSHTFIQVKREDLPHNFKEIGEFLHNGKGAEYAYVYVQEEISVEVNGKEEILFWHTCLNPVTDCDESRKQEAEKAWEKARQIVNILHVYYSNDYEPVLIGGVPNIHVKAPNPYDS